MAVLVAAIHDFGAASNDVDGRVKPHRHQDKPFQGNSICRFRFRLGLSRRLCTAALAPSKSAMECRAMCNPARSVSMMNFWIRHSEGYLPSSEGS